jgi:hypothetical protein
LAGVPPLFEVVVFVVVAMVVVSPSQCVLPRVTILVLSALGGMIPANTRL